MIQHLVMTPVELHQELEAAALRYAAMSPSDFVGDELRVYVTPGVRLVVVSSES